MEPKNFKLPDAREQFSNSLTEAEIKELEVGTSPLRAGQIAIAALRRNFDRAFLLCDKDRTPGNLAALASMAKQLEKATREHEMYAATQA